MRVTEGGCGSQLFPGVRKPAISALFPKTGIIFPIFAVYYRKYFSKNRKYFSAGAEILAYFGDSFMSKGLVGTPAKHKPGQWVQTERKAHEAWANLIARKPRAAQLLHHLVAQMGHQNAVVVSQKVLAQLMGVTDRTVRTAIADLEIENWVQVVRIGKGKEAAYVVNDRVAWGQSRDQLRLSAFSATVIADLDDQGPNVLEHRDLRRIPTLYPGEQQLPSGAGLAPPSQPALEGMEPDLPAVVFDENGREWGIDTTTGELQGKLV